VEGTLLCRDVQGRTHEPPGKDETGNRREMYTVLRHKSERSLYGTLLKRLPDFYPMTVPWGVNRVVQCDAVRLSMVQESAVVILHRFLLGSQIVSVLLYYN